MDFRTKLCKYKFKHPIESCILGLVLQTEQTDPCKHFKQYGKLLKSA